MSSQQCAIFSELENALSTIERHISILKILLNEQPVGIVRISRETGLPEHKVRYSLKILERERVVEASSQGALISPEFIDNRSSIMDEGKRLMKKLSSMLEALKQVTG